jgi:alanine racemase
VPSASTLVPPTTPTWLEVDLDAIAANVQTLRQLIGPEAALAAVVKANAYGLGAEAVARAALAAGARLLAVARIEEGIALRQAGLEAPILNLAHTAPPEAAAAVHHRITPTLADPEAVAAFGAAARAAGRGGLAVHLKVDTGLARFGARLEELPALLSAIGSEPSLQVEGIASHFATADEADLSFARQQLASFRAVLASLREHGLRPVLRHMANSAATLVLPEARFDLVRVGVTLSGAAPLSHSRPLPALTPAVALRARLARVFQLPVGASVGYGQTYVCSRPTRAGLVPAGYADGVARALSNRACVLVHGRRAPLLGRVSMDQCVVDLTDIPTARPGDEVTLIGRQGQDEISLAEFAAWSDTIPHEALCRIGPRVPRCYRWLGAQAGRLEAESAASSRHAWPASTRLASRARVGRE